MAKTRFCVYIGRFQPFTPAHLETVRRGLEQADRLILIVGSATAAISLRNLFSFEERRAIIEAVLAQQGILDRVSIRGIPDSAYNFTAWTARVHELVAELTGQDAEISIIGHFKDDSSYYLNHFPLWRLIKLPTLQEGLSATEVRERILQGRADWAERLVGMEAGVAAIGAVLEREAERVNALREEYRFVQDYRKKWEAAPFPPILVTTDAVVLCMGHVLLIRRKLNPGKGRLALPGGFLEQRETVLEGAIRELREETKIDLSLAQIRMSLSNQRVFDHPDRDPRGRMITHAFLFELQGTKGLPAVKAADDAREALWVSVAQLEALAPEFFSDHLMIIKYFLGRSM